MLDGMAIKSQVDWDQYSQTMIGFCDLGSGRSHVLGEQPTVASEALVMMAVGLVGHWKVAFGYFLINGITAEVQQSIVEQGIRELHQCGLKVVALTMDGLMTNQAMARNMGCIMDRVNLKSSIPNPACPGEEIFIVFDACHCLKLLRGALHKYEAFKWPEAGLVKFSHLKTIVDIQEEAGLKAANKLTRRHIEFQRQKMKVKLAAQVFSRSVAKTLELGRELQIASLEDSAATQAFTEVIDGLFDILNSRSFHGHGLKYPITVQNLDSRRSFLVSAINTLLSIQTQDCKLLISESPRQLSVIGFALTSLSVLGIADKYLGAVVGGKEVRFLLTYKLSQDHLETFFSCVRRACGSNNNPTPKQFQYIIKKLMFRAGVEPSQNANVLPQDETSLLHVDNATDAGRANVTPPSDLEEHSYAAAASSKVLSPFIESICGYVAGWVVRRLLEKLKCAECALALTKTADVSACDGAACSLIKIRDLGGLVTPSKDVITVVTTCEKVLRCETNIHSVEKLPQKFHEIVEIKVLKNLPKNLFQGLDEHFIDTAYGCDSHYFSLVRMLCRTYITVRLHHICRISNVARDQTAVRHWNNKQTLFAHQ